jgi:hypothetical protein
MPTYSNGYIPLSLLVVFRTGHNSIDGDWYHAFSPATLQRHKNLLWLGFKRTGRWLALTDGYCAYRPYAIQVAAYDRLGNKAAYPGKSSHGGTFEGYQSLAGDYGNWETVYSGFDGKDAFYADCRAAGLTPGLISPARGYPDEPWHVVDQNPWSAVPAALNVEPFNPPNSAPEEDDMLMLKLTVGPNTHLCALGTGVFRHFLPNDPFDKIMKVSRSADDWQTIDISELPAFLRTYGCDLNIWDFHDPKTGKSINGTTPGAAFVILDPLSGVASSGGMWSAENAARAKLNAIAAKVGA